jgi:hypothetical protein
MTKPTRQHCSQPSLFNYILPETGHSAKRWKPDVKSLASQRGSDTPVAYLFRAKRQDRPYREPDQMTKATRVSLLLPQSALTNSPPWLGGEFAEGGVVPDQPSHLNTWSGPLRVRSCRRSAHRNTPSHDSSSSNISRVVFHGHQGKILITALLESSDFPTSLSWPTIPEAGPPALTKPANIPPRAYNAQLPNRRARPTRRTSQTIYVLLALRQPKAESLRRSRLTRHRLEKHLRKFKFIKTTKPQCPGNGRGTV